MKIIVYEYRNNRHLNNRTYLLECNHRAILISLTYTLAYTADR